MPRAEAAKRLAGTAGVAVLAILAGHRVPAAAQMAHHQPEEPTVARAGPVGGPVGGSSLTPTPVFDRAGRLWVVFTEVDHVWASASGDLGRTFGRAVRVTAEPEKVDANGEARPKVAIGAKGEIYVAYTRKGREPYTGDIRFSRSLDGGRTFSAPRTVNDDHLATGHRFESLAVGPSGDVFLGWIDKRDVEEAKARGEDYAGGALYVARSADRGKTFSPNRKAKDHVCECCRVVFAPAADGFALFWRDIFDGGVRDHALARWTGAVPDDIRRATFDDWAINACPHHGPALDVGPDGGYHLAWFSAGRREQGLLYARSADGGRTFSEPLQFGSVQRSSHPQVAAGPQRVVLAWKESMGDGVLAVLTRESEDGGRTWPAPAKEALRTSGSSDHPLLVRRGPELFLSWFTAKDGYRLRSLGRL